MGSGWRAWVEDPIHRRWLIALAAAAVAIGAFALSLAVGHMASYPDPTIGRVFWIPGRRGMIYLTAPGFLAGLIGFGAMFVAMWKWPRKKRR